MNLMNLESLTNAGSNINLVDFGTGSYTIGPFGSFNVLIECTSLTTTNFAINGCNCYQYGTGSYILSGPLSSDTGSSRAMLMKTLFYGTDGTDPRAGSNYITSITNLKVFDNTFADVGRQSHLAIFSVNVDPFNGMWVRKAGVFGSTTGNTVSSWSYVSANQTTNAVKTHTSDWTNNALKNVCTGTSASAGLNDEIGSNTVSDNETNPYDCQLNRIGTGIPGAPTTQIAGTIRALILCSGSISWTTSACGYPTLYTIVTDTDLSFTKIHNIPDFGSTGTDLVPLNISSFTKESDISNYNPNANTFVATAFGSQETEASENLDVSFDNGSTWIDVTGNMQKITGSPLLGSVHYRYALTRTNMASNAKIDGFGIMLLGS